MAATTTGTATAALSAEEHDMLLQEDSETVTTPSLVLLAALLAVLEALSLILAVAELPAPVVTVARVVPAPETEAPAVAVAVESVVVAEAPLVPVRVLAVNSLCREENILFMADVPGPLEPVMPVKASESVFSLSGMADGVAKVFVKEKVLPKEGVGCVKVSENLSLLRATRRLERSRGERPRESRVVKTPDKPRVRHVKIGTAGRKGVAGQGVQACVWSVSRQMFGGWWTGGGIGAPRVRRDLGCKRTRGPDLL